MVGCCAPVAAPTACTHWQRELCQCIKNIMEDMSRSWEMRGGDLTIQDNRRKRFRAFHFPKAAMF